MYEGRMLYGHVIHTKFHENVTYTQAVGHDTISFFPYE